MFIGTNRLFIDFSDECKKKIDVKIKNHGEFLNFS